MQATSGIRPNFCCTVCHQQFDLLYDFKGHLESQEHELAYGIRLRNSMVGSYFCNCCHICVNTLLIWKSHIMGTKHMKIACAFSLAYSNFDFDKPARVADVGVLDQNVDIPDTLQRATGRPSTHMRQMDSTSYVIGVTDIEYTAPGIYNCKLCGEPFNEGNKAQHLTSTRHRVNVFKRWDMALHDEAMNARDVGKPEFTERCESIAADIFPVEQNVLNKEQKLLYDRIMGTDATLDERFSDQQNPPSQPARHVLRGPSPPRRPSQDRHMPPDRYREGRGPPPDHFDNRRGPPRDYRGPPDQYDQRRGPSRGGRDGGRSGPLERGGPRPDSHRDNNRGRDTPRSGPPGSRRGDARSNPPSLSIDSDIKCDLALDSVRGMLQNLNIFITETRSCSFTRVEVLKAQILFDEVLKMAYPVSQKSASTDDNYITLFQNGRLTLKRKDESVLNKGAPSNEKSDGSTDNKDDAKPNSSKTPDEPPTSASNVIPLPSIDPPPVLPLPSEHRGPMMPPQPMFDPWGRPIMIPPHDMHGMPFLPPPDYYKGRRKSDKSGRESSPRKRTPPPAGLEISRDNKRNRSRTPDRVVTVKDRLGNKKDADIRKSPSRRSPGKKSSPKRSQTRRSPSRKSRSPRKSPSHKSPSRKSPSRKSPSRKSPSRKSPARKASPKRPSPRRPSSKASPPRRSGSKRRSRSPDRRARSPRRISPRRKSTDKVDMEDGDGTVFLDEGAYAELLNSLG